MLMLGGSTSAYASSTWKEEVLLHDGTTLIVERTQSRGGRHELGQEPPIKESTLTFSLPGSHHPILWKDEFSENIGHSNFILLALHISNGVPYLVASPDGILSYNKWNRPNPPYVIFKYEGKAWQRISMEAFPSEFKTVNLVISTLVNEKKLVKQGLVSAEMVNELNQSATQSEFKRIIRMPLGYKKADSSKVLVPTRDGGWMGLDWFTNQPSLEACLKKCEREKVSPQDCPCNTLFKGE